MADLSVSKRTLLVSTLSSLGVALLVLMLFVLPAEYGLDPTGFGELTGIDGMGGYTVGALSEESHEFHEDSIEFVLAPFESIEYKYELEAGEALVYSWTTNAEVLYDFHSHEVGTDPEEDSISFSVGRGVSGHGTYVAPFSGIHGWFWENRGDVEVVVHLETSGFYSKSTTYSPSGEFDREF